MVELLWPIGWKVQRQFHDGIGRLLLNNQEIFVMRYFISILILLTLCALVGVVAVGQTQDDSVRRITPADARQAFDSGKAIIIDVRDEASYKAGHVKGARWIPVNEVESRIKELPRDKMIITYCS